MIKQTLAAVLLASVVSVSAVPMLDVDFTETPSTYALQVTPVDLEPDAEVIPSVYYIDGGSQFFNQWEGFYIDYTNYIGSTPAGVPFFSVGDHTIEFHYAVNGEPRVLFGAYTVNSLPTETVIPPWGVVPDSGSTFTAMLTGLCALGALKMRRRA